MTCCNTTPNPKGQLYIRKDGKVPFIANQSMGGNKLTDLANGTQPTDAVNYGQLLTALSNIRCIGDTYVTGTAITKYMVVHIKDDGKVYPANPSDILQMNKIIGIAIETKAINADIKIVHQGLITDLSGLLTGLPYFYNNYGILTTSPPISGFTQVVGTAKSVSEFFVNIQIPVGI